ncbi:glycosyltransferase [Latilactobacillus curvatus]|uniref:glycosyltransferase n=1 Tax=Latilactobacillus curvatus TaxID=28038 RepID=UPI000DAAEE38|nr:glycosyltransferase [Latilactobacillus curvatus]AWV72455.1 hypothetical protein C0W45_02460 [Latilactobacillus curvatus]
MKISLIMATYNGQGFIERQLTSIYEQTRPVDEVIIRDDGSTDETTSIIEAFIKQRSLKNWKLIINPVNLGWRDNFSQLLEDSTGDIVFLADQDDYWYSKKIEHMTEYMDDKNIEVLVSDYEQDVLEGASGHIINEIPEKLVDGNLYLVEQNAINYPVGRPGWVYVIKSEFIPEFLEVRKGIRNKGHDALMWQLALSRNSLYHLHEVTGIWTMHPKSAIATESKGRVLSIEQLIQYFKDEIKMIDAMLNYDTKVSFKKYLIRLKSNYNARIKVLSTKSVLQWLINVGKYSSMKSSLGDLKRVTSRRGKI